MKKVIPINTTTDGCAYTIRARYDGACLKSLTGGGHTSRTRGLWRSGQNPHGKILQDRIK